MTMIKRLFLVILSLSLIFMSTNAFCATRFYFPSTSNNAAVQPTPSATWTKTVDSDGDSYPWNPEGPRKAVTTKQNTAMTYHDNGENSTSSGDSVIVMQYVSDPIAAQTISGNIKGQFRVAESNGLADFTYGLIIRVFSNDGSTERGVLLSDIPSSLSHEWSTTQTNRNIPASSALTNVVAQDGDRIVFELGFTKFETSATNRFGGYVFGDNHADDLPEDETTTTANNGWLEFSNNITFYTPPATMPQIILVTE